MQDCHDNDAAGLKKIVDAEREALDQGAACVPMEHRVKLGSLGDSSQHVRNLVKKLVSQS